MPWAQIKRYCNKDFLTLENIVSTCKMAAITKVAFRQKWCKCDVSSHFVFLYFVTGYFKCSISYRRSREASWYRIAMPVSSDTSARTTRICAPPIVKYLMDHTFIFLCITDQQMWVVITPSCQGIENFIYRRALTFKLSQPLLEAPPNNVTSK